MKPGEITPAPVGMVGAPRAAAEFAVVDREQYEVDAELARGGMGRILRAFDRRHARAVAIKELLADTPALRARFRREALITAGLQHPAIVPVYEAGKWPSGEPFYAMKMVDGRSLDQVIAGKPTLDERMGLLPTVIAVAEAIAYAHERHIIHRDLKPANVLVGAFGETVVVDWGLAKDLSKPDEAVEPGDGDGDAGAGPASNLATGMVALSEVPQGLPAQMDGLTVAGHAMGTPAYMAPEQARGDSVDERADVYALGGILYHLLAGRMPYADSKTEGSALLRKVLDEPPPPVTAIAPGAPPDLVAIVAKAMARKPEERYPSAVQLVEDLRRFETGQLVSVRQYSAAELLRRWLRRNRLVVGFAAVLIALIAIGGTLAITRVVRERDRAEEETARAEAERVRAEEQAAIASAARTQAEADKAQAEISRNQAQAAAQSLVESFVQERFAAEIRMCFLSGLKEMGPVEGMQVAELNLTVGPVLQVTAAVPVRGFGPRADACIVDKSSYWQFPPGTRPGEYSLSLMVEPEDKYAVQVGFTASDVDSVRASVSRRTAAALDRCDQRLRRDPVEVDIKVVIDIGTQGEVSDLQVTSADEAVRACVEKAAARWRFPAPRSHDGQPVGLHMEAGAKLTPPAPRPAAAKPAAPVKPPPEGPSDDDLLGPRQAQVPRPSFPVQIDPGLDKAVIRRVVRKYRDALIPCYEAAVAKQRDLPRDVVLKYTITPAGKATGISIEGLGHAGAERCMINVLSRMTFPAPTGGGSLPISVPLNFGP
jgi:serine/threonine protein kinase